MRQKLYLDQIYKYKNEVQSLCLYAQGLKASPQHDMSPPGMTGH